MSYHVLVVALAASVLAVVPTTWADDDKTVLLLYAGARLFPAVVTVDHEIRSTMQSRSTAPVHFYTEYLDLSWFERHEPHVSRLLKQKYASRVKFSYHTGLPMSEVLKSVRALPVGTVVVLSAFLRDGAGQTFTGLEALSLIAGASTVPIYSLAETLLGHGIVGGRLIDFKAQGVTAAELGLRVLDGERLGPSDVVNHANLSMFDARQLARWGISESRLPPGSIVRFRQPSTWELYRSQVTVAVVVTALQTL